MRKSCAPLLLPILLLAVADYARYGRSIDADTVNVIRINISIPIADPSLGRMIAPLTAAAPAWPSKEGTGHPR